MCGGKGKIIDEPCTSCRGTGKERKTRKVSINIPAGVDTGNVMPLRGQGEIGENGGPPGDLYINIRVAPHKAFKRQGFDIHMETHISFAKASFGTEIKVPTVDGDVTYKIPAGTQPGTVFRLKGKGVPRVNSAGRGDHYVKVIVDVPKALNDKQKEALRMFMEASGEILLKHFGHLQKNILHIFDLLFIFRCLKFVYNIRWRFFIKTCYFKK